MGLWDLDLGVATFSGRMLSDSQGLRHARRHTPTIAIKYQRKS